MELEDLLGVSVDVISDGGAGVDRIKHAGGYLTPEEHPALEWQMKGMWNVVAHEYGFIDYRIVGRALSDVHPNDVAAIERILEED